MKKNWLLKFNKFSYNKVFGMVLLFLSFFCFVFNVKADETISNNYTAESIMQWVINNNLPDGDYNVTVVGKLSDGTEQTITYPIELINFYDDVVYSESVSLGDKTTTKRMLVAKYHGNLTINEGVTVTASTNTTAVSGYGTYELTYKKGMYIHVVGSLTNNGIISMTARGTYNQAGEDVFLYKNLDGTFEYIPAIGANGGASVVYAHGTVGGTGENRATGGGGAGASLRGRTRSGAGAAGTSYSGGTGGGGASSAADSATTGGNGTANGGPGGRATGRRTTSTMYVSSGGAGNPGGRDARPTSGANKTVYGNYTSSAQVGTGGLLIIYSSYIKNNGSIVSLGSKSNPPAGYNTSVAASGGSSGGGSINIFTANTDFEGTVSATGGISTSCAYRGGNGGTGSTTVTELILDPEYVNPTLASLEVKNQQITPTFNKETNDYYVTLNSEDYKVEIDGVLSKEDNFITSGIGTFDIPSGESEHKIIVTSKIGTINIYTIHFYRYNSSYNYLNSIKVDGIEVENFNSTTLVYSVDVNPENETVNIETEYGRPSQNISGTGEITVPYGETTHTIDVISEDESNVVTYTIIFKKRNSSKLKSLSIEEYALNPIFDTDTLEYTITIPNSILSLNVEAIPFDSSAKVTIKGNGYLKSGIVNVITVTVSQATVGTTIYKINVSREGIVTQTTYTYSCTKGYEKFEAPGSGYYQIELWGAQGGYGKRNRSYIRGAYGGYTSGTIWLNIGESFYVYVGCVGANGASVQKYTGGVGGYNGGANGGNDKNHDDYPDPAGGGGGATDIRLVNGTWNNFDSLKSRIMIAGGGAGGNYSTNGTVGGLYINNSNGYQFGYGATGGTYNSGSGGGGGGYWGGKTTYSDGGLGYGGTSYVSGATNGTLAITEESTSSSITFKEDSIHYSGIVFENISMIPGNASMPSKTTGYVTGSSGNGYARITLLPTPSENNFLSNLIIKSGETTKEYTPQFSIDSLEYTTQLDINETKIIISGKVEDSTATVNGFGTYDIRSGETIIPISVTAENGDVRTYNIHVNREPSVEKYPNNVIISGLVPSLCSINEIYCKLNPASFNKDTNTYEIIVPSRIKQLYFEVDKKHPFQTVIGEGQVSLDGGENTITIEVTNEAGTESTAYFYRVTRDMTGNTDLAVLDIKDPLKDINYDPDITEYYLSVPNEYTKINEITIVPDDSNAVFIVSGNENFKVGINQVNILVTAQNGETKVYSLMVYREKSGNTFLENNEINGTIDPETSMPIIYPLLPEFNKVIVGIYNTVVPNDVTEITINATVEATETSVVTGTGLKTLKTGNNTFNLIVTAEDGATETYQIMITREKNSNNDLKSIELDKGELNPTFNSEILDYEIVVPAGTSSINIKPMTNESTSTFKLLDNNSIILGENIKRILVIAENGDTKTYTLKIIRPASENNSLSAINLSTGTLNETFDPNITEYTLTLDNNVQNITITGIKSDPLSNIKGNGKYSVATGQNEVILTVTSESNQVKTYLITINRAYNTDATLKSITTSEGTLVPEFNSEIKKYVINVENTIDSILINALPNAKTTKVSGNNTYMLDSGSNLITITTLAEDNVSSLKYELEIVKDTSDNDNLSNLLIEEGKLSPSFDPNVITYDAYVSSSVTNLKFHVETEDENATYQIIGNENLKAGENTVVVRVVSETGQTTGDYKDYSINVNVQQTSTSNYLSLLEINNGTLSPSFDKNKTYYEVEVLNDVKSITVTGIPENTNSTVTGFDTYNLKEGKNVIVITVADSNNIIRDYQIVVNRKRTSEARISNIIIDGVILSPSFNKDVYEYNVESYDETLNFTTIETMDINATYEIKYSEKTNRTDNYVVTIVVTAADKVSTKNYVFNVLKKASNNNNLNSLSVSEGTLSPEFNKMTTLYRVSVDNNVNSIVFEGTPENEYATIEGLGNQNLEVGENSFIIEITSESGNTKSYAIIVTKAGSDNNYLSNISILNHSLNSEFDKETLNYSLTVPFETTNLNINVEKEDENASVIIEGNTKLNVGENIVNIIVTSESGNVKTYVINVTRNSIISALLENISISNYQITPSFNSNIHNYEVILDNEITDLTQLLNITTLDKNATYEITGADLLKVGINEVLITVTSSDGLATETYKIEANRQMYSNAYLDYLYTSSGDLTPIFNKNTLTYTISVENNINSIEFFGEAVDKSATLSGIGVHSLNTGENIIPIKVTTTSGIIKSYYVNVVRAKSDENDLENLVVKANNSKLELNPEFSSLELNYSLTVPEGTPYIEIFGNVSDTALVNGLGIRELTVGENMIDIIVTSESGNIKTYSLKITRPASNNNFLTELEPSIGELSPSFNYSEKEYDLNLDSSAALLSFNYAIENQSAKVTGTDPQPVADGVTVRKIKVTAENGEIREYVININKERTDNAKLSTLGVTGYSINETFDSEIYEYTLNVPNSKSTILSSEVIATPIDANAKISKSSNISLSTTNENIFIIKVTAPDGFTTQNYRIKIIREKSNVAQITSLNVTHGYLKTSFNPSVYNYEWKLTDQVTSLTANDVKVVLANNSTFSATENLEIKQNEENIYEIVITSEDGSATKTYTLKVSYDLLSDTSLKSLSFDKGYFTPKFNKATKEYDVYVYEDETEINVMATANDTVKISSGTGTIQLIDDLTTNSITTLAEDGTIGIYTINIHKTIKKEKNVDGISLNGIDNIECTTGKCNLNPLFDSSTYSYTVKVPYEYEILNILVTKNNENQTLKYYANGSSILNGTYKLALGKTNVTIEVYDGMNSLTSTYNIEIERCKSSNTNLKELVITGYSLSPIFNKDILEYTVSIPNNVDEVEIKATPENSSSIVTPNGYNYLITGENTATVLVIAPDGSTKTYYIYLIKEPEFNSYLRNITISTGTFLTLTPDYKSTTFFYTTQVPSNETTITIEATPDKEGTIISGTGEFPVITGNNKFILTGTAQDGSVSTYTINAVKEISRNVNLKMLSASEGELSPEFEKGTTKYTMNVEEDVDKLTLTAIPEDSGAKVIITGNKNFRSGLNLVYIIVNSSDKSASKTYQILVTKDESSNEKLKSIIVKNDETNYILQPEFDPNIGTYTLEVDHTVASVEIIAEAQSAYARINGTGNEALAFGPNEKIITVTAEDGRTNLYSINIKRNYNLNLSDIITDEGEVSPIFDPNITEYSLNVEKNIDEITVLAQREESNIKVTGNGTYMLKPGDNIITFVATDPENNTKTYTLNVNRAKNDNNYIKELVIHEGILEPSFDKNTLSYVINVRNNLNKIGLDVILEDENATYEVIGNDLKNETNLVQIVVKAENGEERVYNLTIIRQDDSYFSNRLLSITLSEGKLSPDYNPDINYYATTVSNSIYQITINAIKENVDSIVKGVGTHNLSLGRNVFQIEVTSKDGILNTYTVVVYREEGADATLKELVIEKAIISPVFNKNVYEYAAIIDNDVNSANIYAVPTDTNASVEIIGNKNLVVGENVIKVKVTSPDGTVIKEYVIKLQKVTSANNYLSDLTVEGAEMTPLFSKNNQGPYVVTVDNTKNSALITAKAEDEETIITGIGTYNLSSGQNIIKVNATSALGTVRIYTIIINKESDANNNLKSLTVNNGELSPEFDKNVLEYELNLSQEVDSLIINAISEATTASITGIGQININSLTARHEIVVTAENGTTKTYVININKDTLSSTKISELTVKNGKLSPSFHKNTLEYMVLIPNESENLDMDIILENENATYRVIGNDDLLVGTNEIEIIVSMDNTPDTVYKITVLKETPASNHLSDLQVKGYNITPNFSKNNLYYELEVLSSVSEIEILATLENSNATLEGIGVKTLELGKNIFYIDVTSSAGIIRTYTVVVYRKADEKNTLTSLTSNVGSLSPTFDPLINEYVLNVTSDVKNVTISATGEANTIIYGAGTYSTDAPESNIQIMVTSQSGLINIYTIKILRELDNNANIVSITPSSGTLEYDPSINEYTMILNDNVTTISFDVVSESLRAIVSGNEVSTLQYGSNQRVITVTAEDGVSTKIVTVNITRTKNLSQIIPSETDVLVDVNGTQQISLQFVPLDSTYQDVEWISEDETIATVDNGLIKGIKLGDTRVIVRSKKDSSIESIIIVNVISFDIMSEFYEIDRDDELRYITGLEPETPISEFIVNFDNNPNTLHIFNKYGVIIEDYSQFVGNTMTMKLIIKGIEYDELVIIVRGDMDADGLVTVADQTMGKNVVLDKIGKTKVYEKTSDVDYDNNVTVADLTKSKNFILKKIRSLNRNR